MATDGPSGDPERMDAMAKEIEQAAKEAQMAVLRCAAHLEEMAVVEAWNDSRQRAALERLESLRAAMDGPLRDMLMLAGEVRGLASRYRELLG